jgi:hypothetical protein
MLQTILGSTITVSTCNGLLAATKRLRVADHYLISTQTAGDSDYYLFLNKLAGDVQGAIHRLDLQWEESSESSV